MGSREFKKEMRKEAAGKGVDLEGERFGGLEPEELMSERALVWEERLQVLAKAAKIDLGKLPAPKSHSDKALLAAAMKRSTSVANGWLAARLEMGAPASASQFARRLLLTEAGARGVTALLSRVKT